MSEELIEGEPADLVLPGEPQDLSLVVGHGTPLSTAGAHPLVAAQIERDDWASSEWDRPPQHAPIARPADRLSLPEDDETRALYPMADGCLDYFPNALAEVSRISFEGNQKHNPGEPMHWNRGKSLDHRNKIIRHTVESKGDSERSIYHAAQAAWRALADLQMKIERVRGTPMSPGSRA